MNLIGASFTNVDDDGVVDIDDVDLMVGHDTSMFLIVGTT